MSAPDAPILAGGSQAQARTLAAAPVGCNAQQQGQARRRVTLSDVLARLEWALEAIGDGDAGAAGDVLLDLRDELLGVDQERAA